VLDELDVAAFSGVGTVSPALVARAAAVALAVNAEAVRPNAGNGAMRTLLMLGLALGAYQLSAMPAGVTRAFADGVSAYQRGDYATAQRLFGRVGARAPRAADAWANFGTAAWARGDTAHAALGWQRALRLDPLDAESRQRFAAVQPSVIGAPAYVPPVPVNLATTATLVLWLGAWLALAIPASRRPPTVRALAGGALALAVVALVVSLELERRSGVRGLAAIRQAQSLADAPTVSATPLAAVSAGEVGALGAREGAWVRITLDGERAGWLPAAAVLPLDDPVE
jgi:tetratricopeptide (TPR) repeat protein